MNETKKSKSESLNKDGVNKNIIKNMDKDKTFNTLKEIQDLLKKESSLNDLCKCIIIIFL